MRREGGKEKMRVGGKTQDSAGKKGQGRCTAKVLFVERDGKILKSS